MFTKKGTLGNSPFYFQTQINKTKQYIKNNEKKIIYI